MTNHEARDDEIAWRKAIADQVRRNCTPPGEAYLRGGDVLIYAVADWIENPPEWSGFEAPAVAVADDEALAQAVTVAQVELSYWHNGQWRRDPAWVERRAAAMADALRALVHTTVRKHPDPEITKDMVDAAAMELGERFGHSGEEYLEDARAALEAALRAPVSAESSGEGEQ